MKTYARKVAEAVRNAIYDYESIELENNNIDLDEIIASVPPDAKPVNAQLLDEMKKVQDEMACGNFNSAGERISHYILEAEQQQSGQELTDDEIVAIAIEQDAGAGGLNIESIKFILDFTRVIIAADRAKRG